MNYIVCKDHFKSHFINLGFKMFCSLEEMELPKEIAFDSETTSLKPFKGEMFCCQIGTGKNNYLIVLYDNNYNFSDIIPFLENKTLIIHNALFDLTWMYKYNYFHWKVRDTLLASQILYNGKIGIRHGFQYVMERELGLSYDKSEQKNIANIKLNTKKAIQYCFNDVDKLLELKNALHYKIYKNGFTSTYNLHCKWIRACAYMQICGVPINEKLWKEKIESDLVEKNIKEKIVSDYIYDNLPQFRDPQLSLFDINTKNIKINLASPLQMIPVFEAFKINVQSSDKEEGKSIAENVISKSDHEFVKIWLDLQSISHDVSTFGKNFLPSIYNGRLYTTYKPILNTARISAGGKNKNEADDINVLNIPANKKSRTPFEAKKGYKYIVADYEGQENVCTADITDDEVMIKSITDGLDLHCAFARLIFDELRDLTDEEIKEKYKEKRQEAKAPRFALAFGGNGYTIHVNLGVSLEEGMRIEKAYKQLHPGITSFGFKKLEEALLLGYITYAKGFKLYLPYYEEFKRDHAKLKSFDDKWWDKYKEGKKEYKALKEAEENEIIYIIKNQSALDLYNANKMFIKNYFSKRSEYLRLCLNAPSQGTAAHQTKAATNKIYEYIWKNKHFWDARIALVVHDEINMEVKEELAQEYKKIIEKTMIEEGNKYLTNPLLFMSTEANIANNWYDAK